MNIPDDCAIFCIMVEILLIVATVLLLANLGLLITVVSRMSAGGALRDVASLKENTERMERTLREEISRNREETGRTMTSFGDSVRALMKDMGGLQQQQLDTFTRQLSSLTQSNEQKLEKMRDTVEARLSSLQDENSKKLEQMRSTVDEKLHATLERRLGESFQQVSKNLEQVQQGLGEMRSLASGVGDLKKVLTNVKMRGTWGEIQLGNLLEQILSPEQYATNVATRPGSGERVEYAIRLPGRDGAHQTPVWLPIDAKVPQEDYLKLLDAQEQANAGMAEEAGKMMEAKIKNEAKSIREKYLDPPHTTDFGIMFLPIEGLYAEIVRRPGLIELLQREYRVVVAGPTTLGAILNSLQMGFRTLAIEKRSSEVWSLLGAIKTEFGKFGEILRKTQDKLREASNTIETAETRTRVIERKLTGVQQLPAQDASRLLESSGETGDAEA